MFYNLFTYYIICMPAFSYHQVAVIISSVIYAFITIAVIIYWIKSTLADPSDPTVKLQKDTEARGERFDGTNYDFLCEVCNTHVLSDSKHCGSCNRCVNKFDHHCRWINNCVGKKNYHFFIKLIVSVFFKSLMHLATSIACIWKMMAKHEEISDQILTLYDRDDSPAIDFTIALSVALFFNILSVLFLGHLIQFHLQLARLKMTTFDYIKWKEQKGPSRIVHRIDRSSIESSEIKSNPMSSIEHQVKTAFSEQETTMKTNKSICLKLSQCCSRPKKVADEFQSDTIRNGEQSIQVHPQQSSDKLTGEVPVAINDIIELSNCVSKTEKPIDCEIFNNVENDVTSYCAEQKTVKTSSNNNNQIGRVSSLLKIGTGGDSQGHVLRPTSSHSSLHQQKIIDSDRYKNLKSYPQQGTKKLSKQIVSELSCSGSKQSLNCSNTQDGQVGPIRRQNSMKAANSQFSNCDTNRPNKVKMAVIQESTGQNIEEEETHNKFSRTIQLSPGVGGHSDINRQQQPNSCRSSSQLIQERRLHNKKDEPIEDYRQ